MADITKIFDGIITGLLAILLVGGAVYQSLETGQIEGQLSLMATAVVTVYFTGRANRQVNGEKVSSLAQSVDSLHKRLDEAGLPPSGIIK